MLHELPPITFAAGDNAPEAVRSAIAGHPVKVTGKASVYALVHALDRMPERESQEIVMRSCGRNEWLVLILHRASVTGCN